MKFRYNGEVGPDGTITTRGLTFKLGEAVEVTDPVTIAKLKGNRFFEAVDGGSDYRDEPTELTHALAPEAPKRRGRPPKPIEPPPAEGAV